MPQVTAWECAKTGKLFKQKEKYISHLRKLAAHRMHEKRIARLEQDRADFLKRMGDTVKSFKDLEQFIADNWKWFMATSHAASRWMRTSNKLPEDHIFVSCTFSNMTWGVCSNSHSAPRTGVTNWGREPGKPVGYYGWNGRLQIVTKVPKNSTSGTGSSYFKRTGINTGTGGGGTLDNISKCSYDVTLFADDFPAMAKIKFQELMWKELTAQ